MASVLPDLHLELKRCFGFDTFRPGQEAIVRDALAGQDVLAIMPTGGGKSLCFQLPALLHGGVTIVVSPLIAPVSLPVPAGASSCRLPPPHAASVNAASEPRIHDARLIVAASLRRCPDPAPPQSRGKP